MLKRILNIRTVPIAFLLLCVVAYGSLSWTLGFYWDDWPMVWFAHTLGPQGYKEVFASDRPFLAVIYVLTTSLLQSVPWQWQLLGIFSRWLSGLAAWFTLRRLWPTHPERTTWITLLFLIYPGFKQQPISVVYSNGFFLFASYLISLGFMIAAIRSERRFWLFTLLGMLSYCFCIFSTEYYLGLDLIRPLLIWLVLGEMITNNRQRLVFTLRHWLPYLVALSGFLIWRVIIFRFPTYQPELVGQITSEPVFAGFHLLDQILQAVFDSAWRAWAFPFEFPQLSDFQNTTNLIFWLVVLPSIPLISLYLAASRFDEDSSPQISWSYQALLVGFCGLFLAGWPFWITNIPLSLHFPWDRVTLAFMLGSSIFLVGLLEWCFRLRLQKVVALALIISMAIGMHIKNANTYRREWLTQKEFFWQLTWRAPGLKPGTLLLTHSLPLHYYSDNSLTAPLNWTYAPDNRSTTIPYFLAFTQVRLGASIPELKEGLTVRQGYRNAVFESSTSNALVFFYSPPGCLRILHPNRDRSLPILPKELEEALAISHQSQILVNADPPARPPLTIFGPEPAPSWCFYFEKADLARQQGNWQQVVALGDQAFTQGFEPAEPSEYLLFIEAYSRAGDWQQALTMIEKVYSKSTNLQPNLCKALDQMAKFEQATGKKMDNSTLQKRNTLRTNMACASP